MRKKNMLWTSINVMWSKVLLCLKNIKVSFDTSDTNEIVNWFQTPFSCKLIAIPPSKRVIPHPIYITFFLTPIKHITLQNDSTLKFIIFIPVFLCLLSHFQIWAICWRIIQKVNWALRWRTFSAKGNTSNLENDQFNIAKTEKWSKMSSKWWLHRKGKERIYRY